MLKLISSLHSVFCRDILFFVSIMGLYQNSTFTYQKKKTIQYTRPQFCFSQCSTFSKPPSSKTTSLPNMLVLAEMISAVALVLECAANFDESH